jgi:hypothetical protein
MKKLIQSHEAPVPGGFNAVWDSESGVSLEDFLMMQPFYAADPVWAKSIIYIWDIETDPDTNSEKIVSDTIVGAQS